MVKRTVQGSGEPEQASYDLPSEKEHLLQVVDVFDQTYEANKFDLDADTVIAKLEVVGGEEEGRSLLNRMSLDDSWKGFFATRLFLKAIGEEYKGDSFPIDTDNWIGKQFYATIKYSKSKDGSKTYANIDQYNFDKIIEEWDKDKKQDSVNWED